MDPDQYCREIESYLCRRNAGHLVRLVGPAFEMVAGWARTGIPIRVACAGIDRYLDRHDAKAGGAPAARRRPVRAEFCEADVLDAFDQWRRAVGLGTAGSAAPEAGAGGEGHQSLRAHLDRVATRLTDRLADGSVAPILEAHLERLLDELSRMREGARTVRGEARQQVIARLEELDRALLEAVQAAAGAGAAGVGHGGGGGGSGRLPHADGDGRVRAGARRRRPGVAARSLPASRHRLLRTG